MENSTRKTPWILIPCYSSFFYWQINLGLLSFIRNAEKHFWNACQRDGVLLEEGHTTRIFLLCTSSLDEEADTFGKDAVCPILRVISSVPPCKLIEETCKKKFSMHLDYCTTASIDFVLLDEATFSKILKHPDLTVTSEERVLNAILLCCMQAKEFYVGRKLLFGERFQSINYLLPFVRFPLLPYALLKKLERSDLSRKIPTSDFLVKEAI
ncbi:hypothetical protein ACSBR1_039650 [Camellia fascicularis]